MCVDFTYTLFAGFWCDKHDNSDVITFGDDAVLFLIISEGKVGNNHSVDTTFHALATEVLKSELHDRIQVTHKYKWYFHILANITQLFEKEFQGHAVTQCPGSGILNNNAIRHRITEGNPDFNHTDSVLFECTDYIGSTVQCRITCTEINGKYIFLIAIEKLINSIHDYWKFKMMILVHSGMSGYVPYPSFPVLVQNGC